MSEMPTLDRPWLMLGDCLERMREIPDGSVDMVLCDLPYGTTQNKWDVVINFEKLWSNYNRLMKNSGVAVFTACQPFSSQIVMSNPSYFRYEWSWNKMQPTGHLNAKHRPLRVHENVLVFFKTKGTCNPQFGSGIPIKRTGKRGQTSSYGKFECPAESSSSERYPTTLINISSGRSPNARTVHPTQKPVALMEYLTRTYTAPGEIVLDNCFGSGTTGVACANTGRRFIGIERHEPYFDLGRRRIEQAIIAANQPAPFGGLFDAQEAAE